MTIAKVYFWLRSIDSYGPKIGDLIHRNRGNGNITFAQARKQANCESHSAIVVELEEDIIGKYAITIALCANDNETNTRREFSLEG